ncbi:lysozyme C, milk isozyme-like [Alca torda]
MSEQLKHYMRTSSSAGIGSSLLSLLLALLTTVTKAKVFSQCELAHVLQEEELDGCGGYSLANREFQSPVCLSFPAAAVPTDVSCLLSSNITDDIICAKRIVRNPQGMNAWEGWAMHCKGRDLSEWVEGCDL